MHHDLADAAERLALDFRVAVREQLQRLILAAQAAHDAPPVGVVVGELAEVVQRHTHDSLFKQ